MPNADEISQPTTPAVSKVSSTPAQKPEKFKKLPTPEELLAATLAEKDKLRAEILQKRKDNEEAKKAVKQFSQNLLEKIFRYVKVFDHQIVDINTSLKARLSLIDCTLEVPPVLIMRTWPMSNTSVKLSTSYRGQATREDLLEVSDASLKNEQTLDSLLQYLSSCFAESFANR